VPVRNPDCALRRAARRAPRPPQRA